MGRILVGLWLLAGVAGCGETNPFEMTLVSGKIAYEDGTPIKAMQIHISFDPQAEPIDKIPPKSGSAEVNVTDGTFPVTSTLEYGDGLVTGRHIVTAASYDANNNKTDLEVVTPEIDIRGAEMTIEIKVKKP